MPSKSLSLKTLKINGDKTIKLANKLGIINKKLEVQRNESHIYVPITRKPSKKELKTLKEQVSEIRISTYVFQDEKREATNFLELLEKKIPTNLLKALPKAIDFIGDIAIVELPTDLEDYKKEVGEAILQSNKRVRTVLAKAGAVAGIYRLRDLTFIAGEYETQTIHKEYNCKYYVDVAKVYFSPRLSYEHNRVASLVREKEVIVDMFAGVGPFSILIAKTHENVQVYALDINPEAINFLKKNIRLNRVDRKVHPFLGDAKQIVKNRLTHKADRVIMNLPEKAIEFVDVACEATKPQGGIIHFYSFVKASDSLRNLESRFQNEVEKFGRKVEKFLFSRVVRETAPYEWQVVLDAQIS